jgi:hypothetical protein
MSIHFPIPQHPMIMNYTDSTAEDIPEIPLHLQGRSLTLLLGAGDTVHSGVTNVEKFKYDVMVCLPYNTQMFQENVDKLTPTGPVICCLDVNNPQMLIKFIEQFRGRFSTIDGHWAHVPHFALETLEELLSEGGKASNIFEISSGIININTFLRWLEDEYINAYSNIHMSTTKVISDGAMHLLENDCMILEDVLRKKILYLNSVNRNIHLSEEVLLSLNNYRHTILQKIFGSLLHDAITPLSLLGTVGNHQPAWANEESIELVFEKSSPSFWEKLLESYAEIHGRNSVVERAELIMAGVKGDMKNYMIWQSKAKYATFLRHMRTNVLPFIDDNPTVE